MSRRSKAREVAVQMLQSAQAPAIFAGNGAMLSEASTELAAFAELLAMPVATTLMGKGVFAEDHPLACGMSGIWGTRVANETMRQADVNPPGVLDPCSITQRCQSTRPGR